MRVGAAGLLHEEHPVVFKWGINEAVGSSEETVWTGSTLYGTTPAYPSSATITRIVSAEAADTMVATISGNDANGLEVIQTATLTGVTPVVLGTPLKRVYRVSLASANAGLVSVTDTAGTSTFARVEAGVRQTQMAILSIPATTATGRTVQRAELVWLHVGTRNTNAAQVRLTVNGIRKDELVFATSGQQLRTYGADAVVGSGLPLAVGDDIEVRSIRTGGSDASVFAHFKVRYITE